KSEQRTVSGGCGAAQHCYDTYFSGYTDCIAPIADWMATGNMLSQKCYNQLSSGFFNCWDDACNAQSS
ncbi:hypothetical protein ABTQ09_20145, partial [Acinetobacter baumannii]